MEAGKLNQWLTLGANVGVLVGIALILFELRQNAELMRAQMIQSRTDNISAKYDAQIHSDYWPGIWSKRDLAESDVDWFNSLNPSERTRVRIYYFREYDELRNQFFQYQQGYLPQQFWDTAIQTQIGRMIRLMVAMEVAWGESMKLDPFRAEVIRVAQEDRLARIGQDGVWTSQN